MILEQIVSHKRTELAVTQKAMPLEELKRRIANSTPPSDFAASLRGNGISLIAEVKQASPSRGMICPDFDPVTIARTYAACGVAAISVMTESRYFWGSITYLQDIASALGTGRPPLLRKDFMFEDYQVYESRAYGADALLLIVAMLTASRLGEMLDLSHHLGMQCLVEVHDESELAIALSSGANIIGINNRDLRTFKTDLAVTARLKPLIPAGKLVVSESGIRTGADIGIMRKLGIDAVLIGEALMATPDIPAKIQELS